MTLSRICEPELMLEADQVSAYAAADFSAGDGAMVERLAGRWQPGPGERVLDLGCGPGNITLLLAERWPGVPLVGVDGSPAMLAIAEQRRLGLGKRGEALVFHQALLPMEPAANARLRPPFAAVLSNSLLHHLHDPAVLWRSVKALAAPGAVVQVLDLCRPADGATLAALVARHGAAMPAVLRRDYANSLRAAFSIEEVEAQLARAGLDLQVQRIDEQHLEVWGRLPAMLTP
ncbi:MAG: class I SAM-dependent methyltransferase [Prochlorococcaceae cyanobacterium]